jgi:hypothetical protein
VYVWVGGCVLSGTSPFTWRWPEVLVSSVGNRIQKKLADHITSSVSLTRPKMHSLCKVQTDKRKRSSLRQNPFWKTETNSWCLISVSLSEVSSCLSVSKPSVLMLVDSANKRTEVIIESSKHNLIYPLLMRQRVNNKGTCRFRVELKSSINHEEYLHYKPQQHKNNLTKS